MNKIIISGIIAIGISILFSNLSNNAIAQQQISLDLYEDQALYCIQDPTDNKGTVCKIVQDLDLLDEQHERIMRDQFIGDQDTFSINDVFDIESLD